MGVTFVMPFRNCIKNTSAEIWNKCLENIKNQTYTKIQYIFVDDYSDDCSSKQIENLNFKNLILLKNKSNLGLTKSLNVALKYVNTELVARHDSDDYSTLDRIEKQVALLKNKSEIGIVGSYAYIMDKNMDVYDKQIKPVLHEDIIKKMKKENPFNHGSVVFRSNLIEKVGNYDESYYCYQDYELWYRMASKGIKMHNIPEFLYYRTSHKGCASKSMPQNIRTGLFKKIKQKASML